MKNSSTEKTREKVYSLLKSVPEGRVTTYSALAKAAATHPRAVAAFMKSNKDPAGIPCYKVVRSDGSLGGYSCPGGVKRKAALIRKEGIPLANGKIDLESRMHRF